MKVAAIATRNGAPIELRHEAGGILGPVLCDRIDFTDSAWAAAVMTSGDCERAGAEDYLCAHDPLLSSGALKHKRAADFLRRAVTSLSPVTLAEGTVTVGPEEMQRLYGDTRPVRRRQLDEGEILSQIRHWDIARAIESTWAYWSARFFADACAQGGYGCIIGSIDIEVGNA